MGVDGFVVRALDHPEARNLRTAGDGAQARDEVEVECRSVADGVVGEKCGGQQYHHFNPLPSGEKLQNADAKQDQGKDFRRDLKKELGARIEGGERKEDGEVGPALADGEGLSANERRGKEKRGAEKQEAEVKADKSFAPEVLLHVAAENVKHDQRDDEPRVWRVDKGVGQTAPEFAPAEDGLGVKSEFAEAGFRPGGEGDGNPDHADNVESDDNGRGVDRDAADPSDRVIILGAAMRDHKRMRLTRFVRRDKGGRGVAVTQVSVTGQTGSGEGGDPASDAGFVGLVPEGLSRLIGLK